MEELNVPIREQLSELNPGLDTAEDQDGSKKIDRVFFLLFAMVAYGMIQRIAQAVGSEHLLGTYDDELMKSRISVAKQLIDSSIKMGHFRPFPDKQVIDLSVLVRNNKLALSVLRQMVRDHFHLTSENRELRQKVCDKVGISFQEQRMIEQKSKL